MAHKSSALTRSSANRVPWFAVRRDLGARRNSMLSLASFIGPVAIWCLVSYCPYIWHPDVRLQIAANREDVNTVFVAGDRVSREYFPEYQASIRRMNDAVRAKREAGETYSARENKKLLRQIAPLATANGWISTELEKDDAVIHALWLEVADGRKVSARPPLTQENLAIARENAAILKAASETHDPAKFPTVPFAQMIPQGLPSNPDYLPAPHEVLVMGWREFKRPVEANQLSLTDRLSHSVRIVFGGFLIACLIGVPLGVLCGTYQFFSRLFEPFIDFFRYMPAPAFSTLLVALFAANDAPKIALVVVGTLFQMVLVIAKTTRLLDVSLLEAAQTLGASQRQLVTRVVIPGILPNLYNDMRILLGWAWTWLVIAELIGVKSGLTELIETQGRWRNFDRVFPIIILIGMLGFCTDQFLARLHRVFFPYAEANQNQKPGLAGRFLHWLGSTTADRLPPDWSADARGPMPGMRAAAPSKDLTV
jgi:NitT/TauT family transport system permease protein